jgi:hypothetical protein
MGTNSNVMPENVRILDYFEVKTAGICDKLVLSFTI